jgi:glycosyltransferase involved in cell wall biosynthesis
MRPVLFVTGHVPAYRVAALQRLHEQEQIEVATFGGRSLHGGAAFTGDLPFPHRRAGPAQLARMAAAGGYRAVVCPTGGRAALLATWTGARAGRAPLILWASLWAHPRSAAHVLSYLPLRRLYRSADAVVTYGPHVSAYVSAHGARNVHVAPQSVDNDFWRSAAVRPPTEERWPAAGPTRFLFVGRPAPEKGVEVLLEAWRRARLSPREATLALVGVGGGSSPQRHGEPSGFRAGGDGKPWGAPDGAVLRLDPVAPAELRAMYAASEVLVLPSIATPTFREPWGLVVNEAMNRGLAVIASDAVGAAAGGLVRDGESGLVVPAGDAGALAAALARLAEDAPLRERLAAAGRREVDAYTPEAWAEGFSRALATVGLSRARW